VCVVIVKMLTKVIFVVMVVLVVVIVVVVVVVVYVCMYVGVSGKMSTESASEDDNFGTENSQVAILAVLGRERRDRVLAGLYMGRSDTALMVRQAALHVWKVIVAHTPKMLREIMSTLFQLLLGCLASQSYDKRQVFYILTMIYRVRQIKVIPCRVLLISQQQIGIFTRKFTLLFPVYIYV